MADRDELIDAYREFIREQSLRFEHAMRALSADIREEIRSQREESRRYFERIDRRLDRLDKRYEDLHDESRAQTQALLRVIDRLDNGGAAPAG